MPAPTQAPQETPSPVPTATPSLDVQSGGRSLPVPPLVLGGGLAAIIVVAIFIGILVQSQNRQ
jgi:hypothetical protein